MNGHTVSALLAAALASSAAIAAPAADSCGDESVSALHAAYANEMQRCREREASDGRSRRDLARADAMDRLVRRRLLEAEAGTTSGLSGSVDDASRLLGDVALGLFQDGAAGALPGDGGGGGDDTAALARATQNPVADLISVPFQNNMNFNVGRFDRVQNVMNIQPVIPISLNDDWNLITRTIIPIIYQPALFSGDDEDFGLGDIQFTAFFSPKKPAGGWIWGVGPVLQFPTSTDRRLGARKWSLGPSAVVLRMDGPWVYGALFQNVWSLGGSGDQDVNAFLVQPFLNYNLDHGWYLTSSPIITANWEADSSDQWTIPMGGGAGRVFKVGTQPVNFSVQGYYNIDSPDLGADWTLRIQLQLLFPK